MQLFQKMDWKKEYKYLILIFGVHLLFFEDILFRGGYMYPFPDIFQGVYPLCYFTLEEWSKSGEFPLWVPYVECGVFNTVPFLVFSPLNFALYLFLPLMVAIKWSIVLVFLLCGTFTYIYARSISLSPVCSLLSAICYSMNGFFISYLDDFHVLHAIAFLPLSLYVIEKSMIKKNPAILSYLAPVLAVQAMGGQPQFVLYSLMVLPFYFGFNLYYLSREKGISGGLFLKYSFFFISSLILALGIGSLTLLPTYEYVSYSYRGHDCSPFSATTGSLNPLELLNLLFPHFFGTISPLGGADANYWGLGASSSLYGYVGFFPLVLAGVAITSKSIQRRNILFFTFLLFFSVLFAMGQYGPFAFVIPKLPFLKLTRNVDRALMLYVFSVSILSGWGLKRLLELGESLKRVRKVLLYFLGTLCLSVVVVHLLLSVYHVPFVKIATQFFATHPEYSARPAETLPDRILTTVSFFYPPLLLTIVLGLIMVLLISLLIAKRVSSNTVGYLVVAFTLVPLFYFGKTFYYVRSDSSLLEAPAVAKFLRNNYPDSIGKYRVFTPGVIAGQIIPYNDYALKKEWLFLSSNILYDIETVNDLSNNTEARYFALIDPLVRGNESQILERKKMLDLLNVRFIITNANLTHHELQEVYKQGNIKVYENITFLPRAFLVNRIEVIPDEKELLDKLSSPSFDVKETVLLEKKLSKPIGAGLLYEVGNVTHTTNKLSIRVESDSDTFLFVSEKYYPGWRCHIDNKEVEIYRANYAFRGVPIPKGKHVVIFTYQPMIVRLGLYVSLVSLLACSILIITSHNWRSPLKRELLNGRSSF